MSHSEDVDLNQLAKLFDAALASDNESVKKALRNFLFVASITEAQKVDGSAGPFKQLLEQVEMLKKDIAYLRHEVSLTRGTTTTGYTNWNTYIDDHEWSKNTTYPGYFGSTSGITPKLRDDYKDVLDALRKTGSAGDV